MRKAPAQPGKPLSKLAGDEQLAEPLIAKVLWLQGHDGELLAGWYRWVVHEALLVLLEPFEL